MSGFDYLNPDGTRREWCVRHVAIVDAVRVPVGCELRVNGATAVAGQVIRAGDVLVAAAKPDPAGRPCPVCGQAVTRNARGQVLMHTTPATGSPPKSEVCAGSTRGARP